MVAFHNTCQQELEPITAGAMAILVVRLVWTNAPIDTLFRPIDIPAFIEALADVKRCFDRLDWNLSEARQDSDEFGSYGVCGSDEDNDDNDDNDYDLVHTA